MESTRKLGHRVGRASTLQCQEPIRGPRTAKADSLHPQTRSRSATTHVVVDAALERLDASDSEAGLLAIRRPHRAQDLCQRAAILQILGVCLAPERTVLQLFSHDDILLLRLQNHIAMVVLPRGLHILCCLHDLLVVPHHLMMPGGISGSAQREDCANVLLAINVLRGPHLEAAKPVDAVARAVLRAPVEGGRRLLQGLLEDLGLRLVVQPRVQRP
eukprot:UN1064